MSPMPSEENRGQAGRPEPVYEPRSASAVPGTPDRTIAEPQPSGRYPRDTPQAGQGSVYGGGTDGASVNGPSVAPGAPAPAGWGAPASSSSGWSAPGTPAWGAPGSPAPGGPRSGRWPVRKSLAAAAVAVVVAAGGGAAVYAATSSNSAPQSSQLAGPGGTAGQGNAMGPGGTTGQGGAMGPGGMGFDDDGDMGLNPQAAIHGEYVVEDNGSYVTMLTQTGEVTAVSSTSITVKSADGVSRTYAIDSSTTVAQGMGPGMGGARSQSSQTRNSQAATPSISDVKTGSQVGVTATKGSGSSTATTIQLMGSTTAATSSN